MPTNSRWVPYTLNDGGSVQYNLIEGTYATHLKTFWYGQYLLDDGLTVGGVLAIHGAPTGSYGVVSQEIRAYFSRHPELPVTVVESCYPRYHYLLESSGESFRKKFRDKHWQGRLLLTAHTWASENLKAAYKARGETVTKLAHDCAVLTVERE